MYHDDSFFNLTITGRIGLGLLSLLLFALVLAIALWIFRRIDFGHWLPTLAARLCLALAMLWLFEWLSPQIYYQYYRMIFDGLPQQIVIRSPPSPQALFELLTLSAKQALSHHARALLGWALFLLAIFYQRHTTKR